MSVIFQTDNDKNIILYTLDNSIFFRTINRQTPGRPIPICSDYNDELSCCILDGVLYLCYINHENDIIVRTFDDTKRTYSITSLDNSHNPHPVISSFADNIVIIYTWKNPLNNSYVLKCSFPLSKNPDIHIFSTSNDIPLVNFTTSSKGIIFHIIAGKIDYVIHLKTDMTLTNLCDSDTFKQQLKNKDTIIENIKKQYQELMNTATQYRNEARKWYDKLHSR